MTEQRLSTVTDPTTARAHPAGPPPDGMEWVISMVNPRSFLGLLAATAELAVARSVLQELIRLADQAPVLTDEQLRFRLLALAECAAPRFHTPPRSPAGRWSSEAPDSTPGGQPGTTRHCAKCVVSRQRAADPWLDAQGAPIPVRARVEQADIDAELGALRSRLGKRGRVLRRSARRLVVRFEGETALTRIRPHLVRIITGEVPEDEC